MPLVKTFVSLMILFVAVNLVLTIYNSINRWMREGFQVGGGSPVSECQTCTQ